MTNTEGIFILKKQKKKKNSGGKNMKKTRDTIIRILGRDTSREHIFKVCRENGLLQETARVVDSFLDNTMEEVAEQLQIDVRTVQRKINKFIETCDKKMS